MYKIDKISCWMQLWSVMYEQHILLILSILYIYNFII